MPLLALLACVSDAPDAVLVYTRDGETYTIAPREVPALEDVGAVSGTLGEARHGGRFTEDGYTGGAPLAVRFVIQDGVAVPLDHDGLVLWSFYANLAGARETLGAMGVPIDPIFPLPLAWDPAVALLFELAPADNAAYAVGANAFVLLPDGDGEAVPLVANEGVAVHELGHAVFHLRTRGDPLAQPIAPDATTAAGKWQASLHEGFADALATLLLDTPDILAPSLEMPARRVDGDAVFSADLLPTDDETVDLLAIHDPYPLGTVFASLFWDLRDVLGRDRTLALLVAAADGWAPETADDLHGEAFLAALHAAADTDAEREAICDAVEVRFGGLLEVPACG